MDYLEFRGREEELCGYLVKQGVETKEDAKRLLDFLKANKSILSETEKYSLDTTYPSPPPGMMCMMVARYDYYINLKVTTIALVALLLDINVSKGIASTLVSLSGAPSQAFVKLNEENGEKCILKETLLQPRKKGNKEILNKFNGECCNNHMDCQYRRANECRCTEENVLSIYERLTEKNVFCKSGNWFEYQR